ncbi:MAG: 50S ribosomal protein L6 [candidate division WOR-3 bacterium]|nr:50S ribosomal protein L6 [candidate division WOR-3 bacterium]MDH5683555.1 50S ribosomal protein L6 [candidate division WOR-3 bacterium]
MARTFKPIPIPKGVNVEAKDAKFIAKSPLGTLELAIDTNLKLNVSNNALSIEKIGEVKPATFGTTRALIINMLKGVSKGYEKILEVRGMGFRAQKTKDGVQLLVGYSHPINIAPPKGITFELKNIPNPEDPKTQITEIIVKGIDKQLVGATAAQIRRISPPDVYHGKGIRYQGEYVRKKAGKRAIVAQT